MLAIDYLSKISSFIISSEQRGLGFLRVSGVGTEITKTRKRYVLWYSYRQLTQLKFLSRLKAYIAAIAKVCNFPLHNPVL